MPLPKRAGDIELALGSLPTSRGSRQRWLYDELRHAILAGRLRRGMRLPATRDLARQYGLARGTVVAAFEQLIAEGYAAGVVGRGTFVAERLPQEFLEAKVRSPGVSLSGARASVLSQRGRLLAASCFPLGGRDERPRAFRAAQPDLAAFPIELWTRIAARRARLARRGLLADADARGYRPLREALAAYLGTARAIACSPDEIVIVSSVQQALDLCGRLLLDPGDAAWVEDPGYPGARLVLAGNGARVVGVPVDENGIDVERGVHLAPEARLAYVTPGRQAPLGPPLSLERRLALLGWARAADAFVFEDDYDSEYRFSGRPLAALKSLDRDDRVIYAGTFSKLLFPALRLAYAVLPSQLVEPFAAALSLTARHAPTAPQAVLHEFIAEGHFARHIRRARSLYAERAAALEAAARSHWQGLLTIDSIEAGLDVAARLDDAIDAAQAARAAAASGLEVIPLASFALRREAAPEGFVLGFAALDTGAIEAGARTLAAVLERAAQRRKARRRRALDGCFSA